MHMTQSNYNRDGMNWNLGPFSRLSDLEKYFSKFFFSRFLHTGANPSVDQTINLNSRLFYILSYSPISTSLYLYNWNLNKPYAKLHLQAR